MFFMFYFVNRVICLVQKKNLTTEKEEIIINVKACNLKINTYYG